MNDTPTLVRFISGWERAGIGKDGMPVYHQTIMIQLDRPPSLSVLRVADQNDFHDHPGPFNLFQKEQAARKESYSEGYPLCMWPAVNEAEFRMLIDRDITTVDQLAGLHKKGDLRGAPPEIKELAARAAKLVDLQKGAPKYEDLLKDRDGRIEVLEEQVREASITIAQMRTQIDQLRIRGAM